MKTVFVAGHRGMVGAAIVKQLEARDGIKIITQTRSELDLTNQAAVSAFFAENAIDEVYLAAAKVGGIHANNTYPAEFIYENLSFVSGLSVRKLSSKPQSITVFNHSRSSGKKLHFPVFSQRLRLSSPMPMSKSV